MIKLNTVQKKNKLNEVYAVDEKGNGGAYHKYRVDWKGDAAGGSVPIQFQQGARHIESSTHGILDTDLLEIVKHRLECFQDGEFATQYNQEALEGVTAALEALNRRVKDRAKRGVLGTENK